VLQRILLVCDYAAVLCCAALVRPAAWQLLSVQRSLTAYYERFKAFLNPSNAQNLQLLLRIAAALHGCLAQNQQQQQQQQQQQPAPGSFQQVPGQPAAGPAAAAAAAAAGRVVGVNDLLFDLGLDNINMFELARWVRDNKMAFKVRQGALLPMALLGSRILCGNEGQHAVPV
jgi:hypothetical protein